MEKRDLQEMFASTKQAVENARRSLAVSLYLRDLRRLNVTYDARDVRAMVNGDKPIPEGYLEHGDRLPRDYL